MSKLYKKLTIGSTVSRLIDPVDSNKAANHKVILDFVFAHVKDDRRPYLKVSIYNKSFLGLLDSGCTTTILGAAGWNVLRGLDPTFTTEIQTCRLANGQTCDSIGFVYLPIQLQDRIKIIRVLIVPSIPHEIILGIDFWSRMEIIPDLFSDEWSFRSESHSLENQISAIQPIDSLNDEERETLNKVVTEAFQLMGDKLGCTDLVELKISTDSPPIKQRYYPLSPALRKDVNTELDKMLAEDIVEPSNSPWSSPIILIKKPDGGWRFCVDYRALNKVSLPDAYPLPFVSHTLDKLRDARYLSTLDIKSAYWQIPVAKESRPLTAFTVPNRGLFRFKRMPFGLHSAPAVWQRLIDRVIGVDLEKYVFVYLDDVIVCTPTFELHVEILKEVLNRICKAGLTLNRDKCNWCKSELKYLGYVVNASGLLVDPDKVDAVLKIPTPHNVKEVRRIIGLASWYRRFVPNFSSIISPLTSLICKNKPFVWDSACEMALTTIKEHLVSAPVLSCPNFEIPFCIQTDASDFGLGAVLSQTENGVEKVICYASRSLTKAERKYSTVEKECLAVLFAVEKWRPYIEGTKFTVVTDHHSLKWLHKIKDPIGRIARWSVRLQQYDFEVIHRPGKNHIVPDTLSRSVTKVDCVQNHQTTLDDTGWGNTSDKWYKNLKTCISNNPESYPQWTIHGNNLYKKSKPKYPDLTGTPWLCVVPKDFRKTVIREHHDPPHCGHLGVFKTAARISERFYWPKLRADVANYIRHCVTCLQTKPEQKPSAGRMLSKQPTAERPWQLVSVDLVGPLPKSSSGYMYILSVLDCFSKFVLFFPLRRATTPAIVKSLEDQVILIYGAPETIIVDNGPQFRSSIFRKLMENYSVTISFTPNYHPQANPVERVHRVLKTMLASYVRDKHQHWDRYLHKVASAIRSSRSEVTNLTPNFINFGREIRLSGNTFHDLEQPPDSIVENPENVSDTLKQVFLDVRERLTKAYHTSKKSYDLRRRSDSFQLNQRVWKRNYVLSDANKRFTSKLAPKFSGPFVITRVLSPWTYELADSSGHSIGTWHAKDLKAHPPDEELSNV